MYVSTAYGLTLHSEFSLFETVEPRQGAHSPSPDVVVRLGTVPEPSAEAVESNSLLGGLPGVTKLWIRQGREIIVAPEPGIDETVLRPAILGTAMAVILQQRGFLVLHASCVAREEHAIAFLGNSGSGKSTTASVFHTHGYQLVTDDVLGIQLEGAKPQVLPSFPSVKLLPDAAGAIGHAFDQLPALHAYSDKRLQWVEEGFLCSACPLDCIYVLGRGTTHQIEPMTLQQGFMELVSHARGTATLSQADRQEKHFSQCATLVKTVPMRLLRRHPDLNQITDLVGLVEKDWKELAI